MTLPHRVIVIAGASCVGKSTLIDGLRGGKHPRLAAVLGLTDPEIWAFQNARRTAGAAAPPAARHLVLHYDIVRPVMERSFASFDDDPGLAPAVDASDLCICTMWGAGELLRARATLKTRRRAKIDATALRAPVQWWMRNRRMKTLRRWYRDDDFIRERYQQWFAFVESMSPGMRHLVVNAHDAHPVATPFARWSDGTNLEEAARAAG